MVRDSTSTQKQSQKRTAATMTEETTRTSTSAPRCTLRNLDELEGTILVPDARPIDANGQAAADSNTCVMATALPTTYFQYEQDIGHQDIASNNNSGMNYSPITPLLVEMDREVNNNSSSNNVPDAPVIPTYDQHRYENMRNTTRDRHLLAVGEQRGLIDNEQQREEIQRANRKVASIDYFARQQVEEANRLARSINRKEEAKLLQAATQTQATATSDEKQNTSTASTMTQQQQLQKKEPEHFKHVGTFGKEYETAEYNVGEFSTTDYKISEYKSVYE
jgi:hypothetical protein